MNNGHDEPALGKGERRESRALTAKEGARSVLIVGAGGGGQILARELIDVPRWKLWPVAFVDDDKGLHGTTVEGVPVLGDSLAIPTIVENEQIDVIVLAIPSLDQARARELESIASGTGRKLLTMPGLGAILHEGMRPSVLTPIESKDILGRPVVRPDRDANVQFIIGRRVLITGAAGSIGSELARQTAELEPELLILQDIDESGLHDLREEILADYPSANVITVIASVFDPRRSRAIFEAHSPEIVLHAAAYKHVPAMESQPDLAIETNVIGTKVIVELSVEYGVERFIMVSTDKAVRPTSVMGASKRLAELVVTAIGQETGLSVASVRFGNVLNSRGSVIPKFELQIRKQRPITITDMRMERYFMTIPEAASLILQAGAFGDRNATYILDMGDPVKIVDLAESVIRGSGLRPYEDIEIREVGIRKGEKLSEDLSFDFEAAHQTRNAKIRVLDDEHRTMKPDELFQRIDSLENGGREAIMALVAEIDGQTPVE